jgi:NAD(P)-dependent dehydrogenase (short-subunit alcohol dehydrogenase family)
VAARALDSRPRRSSPAEGAFVFIIGRRQAELDAAASEIADKVQAFQGDMTNLADLGRFYATVKAKKGRIDIVFANAAVAEGAPLAAITEDHFDRHFDINVKGLVFAVQKALPLLADGSSIVLTSSVSGVKGTPGLSNHSATKAAIRKLARSWVLDLKARKIRVNAVSPGATVTTTCSVACAGLRFDRKRAPTATGSWRT